MTVGARTHLRAFLLLIRVTIVLGCIPDGVGQAVGERLRCPSCQYSLRPYTRYRHLRTEERADVCQCRFVTDHCSVLCPDVLDCVLGISYGNSCNRRYPFTLPHGLYRKAVCEIGVIMGSNNSAVAVSLCGRFYGLG